MPELVEPPDLSIVRTGREYPWRFWYRDDRTAIQCGNHRDDRWWEATDDLGDPMAWEQIVRQGNPLVVRIEPVQEVHRG